MAAQSDYVAGRTVLVCNDDGIFSPGIKALSEVAAEFGDVEIVAPDRQQSAVGHSITISQPLRVNRLKLGADPDKYGRAINGTPADCVKLAHDQLLSKAPDLVLSGINHGSNAGINIIYSGTVSAATEGTILGYPSIAVSCTEFSEDADLSGCKEATRRVIRFALENGLPKGITLNLNAPAGPLKDIRWARQADGRYVREYDSRIDPFNRPYYWLTGDLEVTDSREDLDVHLLKEGFATVTPIQYDLTDHAFFQKNLGVSL